MKIKIESRSDCIIIKFAHSDNLVSKVKSIRGSRWLNEKKVWAVPKNQRALKEILSFFSCCEIEFDRPLAFQINKMILNDIEVLKRELIIRKYSKKTFNSYVYYNLQLLRRSIKTSDLITNNDIKNYLHYLIDENNFSTSTINTVLSALKFYYEKLLRKNFFFDIQRPKKDKKLPSVLNKDEIMSIFKVLSNLKHRAILMTIYSSGLRVSEVVKLRSKDIDRKRKTIFIKGAKGRKDRYSLLADTALVILTKYFYAYEPKIWLFPGQNPENHISIRTVQEIFYQAKVKANITKDVTVHSLRHSFATHLLESGVDIRYIQELLGHKSTKTTEIYTHVSVKNYKEITNPLDKIFNDEK